MFQLLIKVKSILVFAIWISISSCNPGNSITPDTIISQLPAGPGWAVKEPNRPNMYKYKIARDSGYATITVSLLKENLFCKYDYREYETATDLSRQVSFPELKKQFEQCEAKDKRAVPFLHSTLDTSLGGVPCLRFASDYRNIDPPITGGIEYYVIRASDGWIIVATAFIRKDEYLYRKEFQERLKKLKF